jgi:hypothetical protein
MTHTTDEALKLALEALIHKANMIPVMQGNCYVMHPEAMQAVIDEAIKQALAAPAQPAVPEGLKLVPIEPTNEMIDAGNDVEDLYRRGTPETWGKVYRAMIRAVPAAQPAPEQGQP